MTEEKKIQEQEVNENPVAAEAVKVESEPIVAKKGKRTIFKGQAHIQCTYNNTIVTISDMNGATLGWSSSGMLGFKGAKKSTPFAATKVAADVSEKVKKYGLKELLIFIKGVGGGRESAVRGLSGAGFDVISIKDITPNPHNGCRRRKPRRV
ncbi:MAG: 30S ribosomal protein S11 [Candidatus Moraniibacteriota bacterium]